MAAPESIGASRLELLRMLDILDTPAEPAFDALVQLAGAACGCPISLISLIDADRQWFKASVGLDATETPRDQAFCDHAIRSDALFHIPDATRDARFVDNPLVTGDPGIRFYAGHPIVYQGVALGTLCVIDRAPRELDDAQRETLRQLSLVLAALLQGRMESIHHRREAQRLHDFAHLSGEWLWESDRLHRCTWLSGDNEITRQLVDEAASGRSLRALEVIDGLDPETGSTSLHALLDRGVAFADVVVVGQSNEGRRFFSLTVEAVLGNDACVQGFRGAARDVTDTLRSKGLHQEREATTLASLRATERRLRSLTDNLPALIAYLDHEQRYTFVNAHHQRVLGDDANHMLGRTIREFRGEEWYATVEKPFARAFAGERTNWDGSLNFGGKLLHYQGILVPDIDAGGHVIGCYVMIFDTTERRSAELRLATSERMLRAITDSLPALISYVDNDDRYRFANATYGHWFGIDHRTMIGRTVSEVFPKTGNVEVQPYVERARAGERVSCERRLIVDDQVRYGVVDYVPDFAEDGRVVGIYALTTDITERRETEQKAIHSEKRMRELTDALPVLISYIDVDWRMRYVNETFRNWFGDGAVDIIGQHVREVLGEDRYQQRRDYIARAFAGERVSFELDTMAMGVMRHIQITYLPDTRPSGEVVGVTALSMDVTDRIVAAKNLTRLAHFDSLTELPNRLQFDDRLAEVFRGEDRDELLALMFLDIDHFKSINDTYGHAVGDRVLKDFAARLRHTLRGGDFVARLAGDEFVVILRELKQIDEIHQVADRIIRAVDRPFLIDDLALTVTTSIGVALRDDALRGPVDILAKADRALYRAKEAGRNTFQLAA